MDKRVSEAIENVLAEHTFAPDALKAMQAQLDKVTRLEAQVEKLEKYLENANTYSRRQREQIESLEATAEKMGRLYEQKFSMEINAARSDAKADTVMECFRLVFRNAEVRRSVTSSVPVAESFGDSNGGHYTNTQYHTQSEDIVEEEK